jgi:hypothetical protein
MFTHTLHHTHTTHAHIGSAAEMYALLTPGGVGWDQLARVTIPGEWYMFVKWCVCVCVW